MWWVGGGRLGGSQSCILADGSVCVWHATVVCLGGCDAFEGAITVFFYMERADIRSVGWRVGKVRCVEGSTRCVGRPGRKAGNGFEDGGGTRTGMIPTPFLSAGSMCTVPPCPHRAKRRPWGQTYSAAASSRPPPPMAAAMSTVASSSHLQVGGTGGERGLGRQNLPRRLIRARGTGRCEQAAHRHWVRVWDFFTVLGGVRIHGTRGCGINGEGMLCARLTWAPRVRQSP